MERPQVEIDRSRLLDEVLDILADPAVSDADAGRLVRARIACRGCRPPGVVKVRRYL